MLHQISNPAIKFTSSYFNEIQSYFVDNIQMSNRINPQKNINIENL